MRGDQFLVNIFTAQASTSFFKNILREAHELSRESRCACLTYRIFDLCCLTSTFLFQLAHEENYWSNDKAQKKMSYWKYRQFEYNKFSKNFESNLQPLSIYNQVW